MISKDKKIKAGIVGATGYVGAELARLIEMHPSVELSAISSVSFENVPISEVYPAFYQILNNICMGQDEVIEQSDIIFAALPHGLSQELAEKCINKNKIFIDMGADFRLVDESDYKNWYGCEFLDKALHEQAVYGLPELFRGNIKNSKIIANPGCYATAVPLALAPLLKDEFVKTDGIIIDAKSGVTGAGRNLTKNTHFSELNEGFAPYKVAEHRHTPEIEQTLKLIAGQEFKITFVPHLLPINRGIIATCYARLSNDIPVDNLIEIYKEFYKDEKFIRVLESGEAANLKNVKYSNYCDISVHKDEHTNTAIIVSAIDNMVKGAAGQAIQNMNILLGYSEDMGLNQIPPSF